MNTTSYNDVPLRFLVIEDDTVTSIDIECMLEDLGHTVTAVAATGEQARQQLMQFSSEIDAVIMDASLVGRSSLPVAEDLRRRSIPCFIASDLSQATLNRMGFRAPSLEKPCSLEKMAGLLAGVYATAMAS